MCANWNRYIWVLMLSLVSGRGALAAEISWTGGGGDGLWINPANWSGNIVPGSTDDVMIDNRFVGGSFEVSLGAGVGTVSIHSLRIAPALSNIITVLIPPENKASPALACGGPQYGLILDDGAIFINASGAASGSTLEVSDSIRINNGGKYVHRTPRSHAEIVRSLSRSDGTENGEFEFKVPVASSTISVSGQVFGRLRLSPGPTGLINYTGTGTSNLVVRSDLELSAGVSLNFNLDGRLLITGNLIHNGAILNLGSTARKLSVDLAGNLVQSPASTISESGSSVAEINFSGKSAQSINAQGAITNDVLFTLNNAAGAVLQHSLTLPYQLTLVKGVLTTNGYRLVLMPACVLTTAGVTGESYIDGQVLKQGLANNSFLFPLGNKGKERRLNLKQASGDFLVEYHRSDPHLLSSQLAPTLHHISSMEYWKITGFGTASTASAELSFDVHSGGVTDLSQLRTASLTGTSWEDAGNEGTTGSAGSAGTIAGIQHTWADNQSKAFCLASTGSTENPLPITWKTLRATRNQFGALLQWEAESTGIIYFILQSSDNGTVFNDVNTIAALKDFQNYQYQHITQSRKPTFYRLIMVRADSSRDYSAVISVFGNDEAYGDRVYPASPVMQIVSGSILIKSLNPGGLPYTAEVIDVNGRLIYQQRIQKVGDTRIPIAQLRLIQGIIVVVLTNKSGNRVTLKGLVQ